MRKFMRQSEKTPTHLTDEEEGMTVAEALLRGCGVIGAVLLIIAGVYLDNGLMVLGGIWGVIYCYD